MGLLEQREHSGAEVGVRLTRAGALGAGSVWAGAAVGALAGNSIGANNARPVQYETVQRPVQQCQTVQEVQQRINGYRVTYDYRGQTYHTVLPNDPGPNMRVRVSVDPAV